MRQADTPFACLRRLRETMRAHGIEDADSTARLMITRVLKISMAQVFTTKVMPTAWGTKY